MKKLNIIGGGRVGQTLGNIFSVNKIFSISSIVNRSIESAQTAHSFIGEGEARADLNDIQEADVYMISASDSSLRTIAENLSNSGCLRPGDIVFHCSGAVKSDILSSVQACGAKIASVHPIKSFSNPEVAKSSFRGTYCGAEGEPEALAILTQSFEACGANVITIDASQKTLYHASVVIACNYLYALEEWSVQTFEKIGINRTTATKIIEPIVRGTVDNFFALGPVDALTGPIARGEVVLVQDQLEAFQDWDEGFATLYAELGKITLGLAEKQGTASLDALRSMRQTLNNNQD